jgi:hypothetical protein
LPPGVSGDHFLLAGARTSCFKTSSISPEPSGAAKSLGTALPWPGVLSGEVPEVPGEDWRAVNFALYRGFRGLPGGDSLAKLLARQRGR